MTETGTKITFDITGINEIIEEKEKFNGETDHQTLSFVVGEICLMVESSLLRA